MPRVSGAVGAISLHSSVCSNNLSLSVPGVEYLLGGSQWLSRGHNHGSHRSLSFGSYSTRRRRPCHVGQRFPGRTQDPCWCVFDTQHTHTHTHTHKRAVSVRVHRDNRRTLSQLHTQATMSAATGDPLHAIQPKTIQPPIHCHGTSRCPRDSHRGS